LKQCSKCNETKSLSEFYRDKGRKDGHEYQCKSCKSAYERQYAKTDKYKQKIRRARWREQNIDITYDKYKEMLALQDNKCAICHTEVNQFNKGMCVDHNHDTGKIRGLLCTDCNMGIGNLKDSIELIENALEYLRKYN